MYRVRATYVKSNGITGAVSEKFDSEQVALNVAQLWAEGEQVKNVTVTKFGPFKLVHAIRGPRAEC